MIRRLFGGGDAGTAKAASQEAATVTSPVLPADSPPAPPLPTIVIGDGGSFQTEGKPAFLTAGAPPDVEIDWGIVEGLQLRAASVRGRMHRYEGTPRQDAFFLGFAPSDEGGYLLLAVADGVGSLPLSHLAAATAVRAGVQGLARILSTAAHAFPEDWSSLLPDIEKAVIEAARTYDAEPDLNSIAAAKRMATTLILAAVNVTPDPSGNRRFAVASIGDTSAWCLSPQGTWTSIAGGKEAAEVSETKTAAIPGFHSAAFPATIGRLQGGDALFLITDGVGDPLGDGLGPVGQQLARQWGKPQCR